MDFTLKRPVLLLLILLLTRQKVGVEALRLLNVTVPPYLKRGESARLECRYDLESDKLYSVSWYKDNEHIYSITHNHNTKKHVFIMEGVRIDTHRSNSQVLKLQDVSLASTGYYACEVNTDNKPFKSVKGEAYMEVIELPRDDPKIVGEERIYATGDVLALNCTCGPSYPEAHLRWYVNDIPIDNPDSESWHMTSRGLRRTTSSIKLQLNPLYLLEERIKVECIATVRTSDLVSRSFVDTRISTIYVQGNGNQPMPSMLLLFVAMLLTLRHGEWNFQIRSTPCFAKKSII